jgi:hypothetical protein
MPLACTKCAGKKYRYTCTDNEYTHVGINRSNHQSISSITITCTQDDALAVIALVYTSINCKKKKEEKNRKI